MPAEGEMQLGEVLLDVDNQLDQLPLGEDRTASEEILSDGTKRLVSTGWQAQDIQLSGTLRWPDRFGTTPLDKMDALLAMLEGGDQHLLQWAGRSWVVSIKSFVPVVLRNNWVQYTLTLFRETAGAFAGTAQSSTPASTPATPASTIGAQTNLPPATEKAAALVTATAAAAGKS